MSLPELQTKVQNLLLDLKLRFHEVIDYENKVKLLTFLTQINHLKILEYFFISLNNYDIIKLDFSNIYIDMYRFITNYDRKLKTDTGQLSTPTSPISMCPEAANFFNVQQTPNLSSFVAFLRDMVPSSHRRGRKRKSDSISQHPGEEGESVSLTNLETVPSSSKLLNLEPSTKILESDKDTSLQKQMEESLANLTAKKKRGRPFKQQQINEKELANKIAEQEAENLIQDLDLDDLKFDLNPNPEPVTLAAPPPTKQRNRNSSSSAGQLQSIIDGNQNSNNFEDPFFMMSDYMENQVFSPFPAALSSTSATKNLTEMPAASSKHLIRNHTGPPPAMLEVLDQAFGYKPYPDTNQPLAFGNLWLPHYIEPNIYNSYEGQVLKELGLHLERQTQKHTLHRDELESGKSEFSRSKKDPQLD